MSAVLFDKTFYRANGVEMDEVLPGNQFVCEQDPERRSSVTSEEAKLLAALAAGRAVLEIGTGLGVSTRAMAETASRVATVDPDPWVYEHVRLPASVARCTSISVAQAFSPFDAVFIDGNHEYTHVRQDIVDALRLGRKSGFVIAFHDHGHPGVRRAIDEMAQSFSKLVTFPTCGELTLAVVT